MRGLNYEKLCAYQTAVGFLLASMLELSSRRYQNALCIIALAVRIFPFPGSSNILWLELGGLWLKSFTLEVCAVSVCMKLEV